MFSHCCGDFALPTLQWPQYSLYKRINEIYQLKEKEETWRMGFLRLSTHSYKTEGPWNELIRHIMWDLAGGGEHVQVEVIDWSVGGLVEPQPVRKQINAPIRTLTSKSKYRFRNSRRGMKHLSKQQSSFFDKVSVCPHLSFHPYSFELKGFNWKCFQG